MLLSLLNRFQALKIGENLIHPLSVTSKAEFHEFGYRKRSRKKPLKKKHQIDPEVNNVKLTHFFHLVHAKIHDFFSGQTCARVVGLGRYWQIQKSIPLLPLQFDVT